MIKKSKHWKKNVRVKLKNNMRSSQDVGKKHQIKIALQTLRSADIYSSIMGGPDKEESIEILLNNGWTKDKVKNYLKQHSHSDSEISKFESLNENFDPMDVYNGVKSITPYVFGIALGSLLVAKSFPNFIERALESTVEGLEAAKFKQKLKQLENDIEVKKLANEFSSLSGQRGNNRITDRRKVIRGLIREKLKTIFGDYQFKTISTAMTDQAIDKKLRNINDLKENNSQHISKFIPNYTDIVKDQIKNSREIKNSEISEVYEKVLEILKNEFVDNKDESYSLIKDTIADVINNLSESIDESLVNPYTMDLFLQIISVPIGALLIPFVLAFIDVGEGDETGYWKQVKKHYLNFIPFFKKIYNAIKIESQPGIDFIKFESDLKEISKDVEIKKLCKEFFSVSGKGSVKRREEIQKILKNKLSSILGQKEFKEISVKYAASEIAKLDESLDPTEVRYIKQNFGKIVAFANKNNMDIEDAKSKFLVKYKDKSNIKESAGKENSKAKELVNVLSKYMRIENDKTKKELEDYFIASNVSDISQFTPENYSQIMKIVDGHGIKRSGPVGHINESDILKKVIKKCLNEIFSNHKELEDKLNTLLYVPMEKWNTKGIKLKAVSSNSNGMVNSGILSTGEHFYRSHPEDKFVISEKTIKESDPCWKNYEMVGMKTKNGKKVPNCVPKK